MSRKSSKRNKVRTHLTALVQPINQSPRLSLEKSLMALRSIITLPDPKLRLVSKPIERVDGRSAPPDRRHDRDDVRRAGRRPRGDSGRRADSAAGRRHRQEGRTAGDRRCSSIPRSSGRPTSADLRGGLPFHPGILRGGRAAGDRSRPLRSTATARYARSSPRACSRPSCSMRSIISTACCSSTTSRSSSATG